jgi:hypothetical protein
MNERLDPAIFAAIRCPPSGIAWYWTVLHTRCIEVR